MLSSNNIRSTYLFVANLYSTSMWPNRVNASNWQINPDFYYNDKEKKKTINQTKCLINKINLFVFFFLFYFFFRDKEWDRLIKTNCNCIQLLAVDAAQNTNVDDHRSYDWNTMNEIKTSGIKKCWLRQNVIYTQHHIYLYNWELTYFLIVYTAQWFPRFSIPLIIIDCGQ